jgi:hypothetical protein
MLDNIDVYFSKRNKFKKKIQNANKNKNIPNVVCPHKNSFIILY